METSIFVLDKMYNIDGTKCISGLLKNSWQHHFEPQSDGIGKAIMPQNNDKKDVITRFFKTD